MGFTGHKHTKIHLGPAPIPEPGAPREQIDDHSMRPTPEPLPPTSPRLGSRLGPGDLVGGTKYRIVRFIGDGGMGEVYEAIHLDLDRPVALKILLPELSNSPRAVELFRSEARSVSRVGAEEIVQLFDFADLPDGRVMFTMELLEGPTLAEMIEAERPSTNRIITILRQICAGLTAAHAAGIVHRDIKPDNIVLDRRRKKECVKILDFGIATMLDDPSASNPLPAGTPMYLAPELITRGEFDHRADIYSLGCLAYEMCTGRPPFAHRPGEKLSDVLRRQVNEPPVALDEASGNDDDDRPVVPAALEAIILRCLSKSPEDRHDTVEQLEAALCEAQIQLAMTAPWNEVSTSTRGASFETEPSPAELSGVHPRRQRSVWPLLTVASLAIAAASAVWAMQRPALPAPVVVDKPVPLPVPTPTPIVQPQAPQVKPSHVAEAAHTATAPETTAPKMTAPKMTAPETTAPETTAPKTTAPKMTAPETTTPETTTPETTAPETTAPETTTPETTAPPTTRSRPVKRRGPTEEVVEDDKATDALLTGQKQAAELGVPNPADTPTEQPQTTSEPTPES